MIRASRRHRLESYTRRAPTRFQRRVGQQGESGLPSHQTSETRVRHQIGSPSHWSASLPSLFRHFRGGRSATARQDGPIRAPEAADGTGSRLARARPTAARQLHTDTAPCLSRVTRSDKIRILRVGWIFLPPKDPRDGSLFGIPTRSVREIVRERQVCRPNDGPFSPWRARCT